MELGRKSTGRTVSFKPLEENGFQSGAGKRGQYPNLASHLLARCTRRLPPTGWPCTVTRCLLWPRASSEGRLVNDNLYPGLPDSDRR